MISSNRIENPPDMRLRHALSCNILTFMTMRSLYLLAVTAILVLGGSPLHAIADETVPAPFTPTCKLDRLLLKGLAKKGLTPSTRCSDAVFLRRAYLALTGTIPTTKEARSFFDHKEVDKRAQLIDALMKRPEFADYWTLKWCDILRVKAEFPINLWPNGVQAYARWIHDTMTNNMPYDQFARALLTSNGSNFRVPPVNFYRAVQGEEPATLAAAVALTFMGTRLENWPDNKRANLERFFSRVAFKGTAEWKETIVYPDPAQTDPLRVIYPDGKTATLRGHHDPRVAFADWLISPDNPWFARNIVNRSWSWFFGTGLIDEPDDIRPDNPAVHPEILTYLEKEFVTHHYDLHHLFRVILNSNTYQQSAIPASAHPDNNRWFARYQPQRLDAEVLLDALNQISGQSESYSSAIPEPFTFVPKENRNITLTDGSITSPFLKMFGRPGRDTGLESERSRLPTREQRLLMINSTQIHNKISKSWKLLSGKRNANQQTAFMYLSILSRYPTAHEKEIAANYLKKTKGKRANQDLLWALINSKEFLYQH